MTRSAEVYQLIDFWTATKETGQYIAAWRLPGSKSIEAISGRLGNVEAFSSSKMYSEGFYMHPFVASAQNKPLFICKDYSAKYNMSGFLISEYPSFRAEQSAIKSQKSGQEFYFEPKNEFQCRVDRACSEIRSGSLRKVVLSRQKRVRLPADFDEVIFFLLLAETYPQSFVSLFFDPKNGSVWIGASPELLTSFDAVSGRFRSVALAATRNRKALNEDVDWESKELNEHRFVSDFIVEKLKGLKIADIHTLGPDTISAGNVWHLQTIIETLLPTVKTFEDLLDVVKCVHPTSALCGTPGDLALSYIEQHEPFDRNYYTGFLGPVNIKGQTNLFANIRCMQITGNAECVLYAGCGIVDGSDSELEWEETEYKFQTLQKAIHQYDINFPKSY